MNEPNQGNNSEAPATIPVKRKRGRPRKDQSLNRGENARTPPGFEGANGNQPRQVEPVEEATDFMVGQAVSGVIEAAFDAGYLLSVRVGNSDTILRGVVFKAGRYVPVSAENDVAPNIQMIRRNEVPLPAQNQIQVYGSNPRSRGRNEHYANRHRNGTSHSLNESQPANEVLKVATQGANLMASKGKQASALAIQVARPVASRGNVVPVVLQPVNLSNGIPPATPAPHLASSKGIQVPPLAIQAAHLSNGSPPAIQVLQPQSQSSHHVDDPHRQPMVDIMHEGAKSMNLPGVPFETLLGEVMKRIQAPSQSAETQIEDSKSSGKLSIKDSCFSSEGGVANMNEPLIIKPLQSVQPDLPNQSVPFPKPLENDRTGRMTELLQVLQDNMTENQVSPVQHPDTGSKLQFNELRSPGVGDEDPAHSNKRSRSSSV